MLFKVMPLLVSVLFLFIQPVWLIEKHHFPVSILIPDFPNGSEYGFTLQGKRQELHCSCFLFQHIKIKIFCKASLFFSSYHHKVNVTPLIMIKHFKFKVSVYTNNLRASQFDSQFLLPPGSKCNSWIIRARRQRKLRISLGWKHWTWN